MVSLFDSARLTFARAQYHINEFESIVEQAVHPDNWSYFVEEEPKSGNRVHKVKFVGHLPEMLPCVLFDAANNLRTALDQTGYASAVASGARAPKSTQFPFGDDADGLENAVRRGRCKDLPPEILALFRAFKPYKRPDDTLWALNKLCNTKKHCALVPLYVSAPKISFTADNVIVPMGMRDQSERIYAPVLGGGWNAEKREAELAICPPNIELKISGHVAGSVAIEDIEVIGGHPAPGVLRAMGGIVERVLVTTEAECRRLFPETFD